MQEASIGNPGSIRDDETSHAGFFGSYHDDAGAYDGQIVRYDHSLGGCSFAVSVEQNDAGSAGNGETDTAVFDGMAMLADTIDDNVGVNLALGLKYDLDLGGTTVGLGGGFQTLDANALILAGAIPTAGDAAAAAVDETVNIFAISADVALDNGLVAALQFTSGDIGGVEDSTHIGVGVGYSVDNFSIHANYGQFSIGDTFVGGGEGAADNSPSGFGLAASYDLGGGLSAHFGYGSSDLDTGDDDTFSTYSIGFAMSF